MHAMRGEEAESVGRQMQFPGEFFGRLPPLALKDLTSLLTSASYSSNTILFTEKEEVQGVYFLLDGEVKLSINSSDGRRLSLRIARRGEMLGLSATVARAPCEMTAEALYSVTAAFVGRREFLEFLTRHPEAYPLLNEELTREVMIVCEQLRTLGLATSVSEKLARFLLDWSEKEQAMEAGTKFHFSLTHAEIAEFIGTSRETVTRTLGKFRNRRLVAFHGSTLTIPSKIALANYAVS